MELHYSISTASVFMEKLMNFTVCKDYEYGRIIWCSFSIFFLLLGSCTYISIFYECYKKYNSGSLPLTPNNFFMLNLCVMDWVYLIYFPFGLVNQFIFHIWTIETIWNGIYALNVCGRPLIMACVCTDCYIAVVHPLFYRKWTSLTPRVIGAAVVWIWTLAFGLFFVLYFQIYSTILPYISYIIAVITIIICDCFILYTLMKTGPGSKNVHPQKQRAIQTVINSFVASLLSYIPPILIYIIGKNLITDETKYFCTVTMPVTLFSTMGCVVMSMFFLQNLGGFDRLKAYCCKI